MVRMEPFQRHNRGGWWIKYKDPTTGKWVRRKGGETRRLATLRLASIVSKLDLVEAGLADRAMYEVSERSRLPIADALESYEKYLRGRERSAMHVAKAIGYCAAILRDGVYEMRLVKPNEPDAKPERKRVRIVEPIRATTLAEIREGDVERFLADVLAVGRSVATRNDYQRRLNAFCEWAWRDRRLASNPIARMQMMKQTERRRSSRALSPDELSALLGVARGQRGLYYRVSARAGLRWGEVAALRWKHIDLAGGWIHLEAAHTKAKRADELPIADDLAAALSKARGAAGDDDLLFTGKPTRKTFQRDCERAGLRDARELSPHCLRRTFGTHLAISGVLPQVAQRLMRHSDINLTLKHYTDLKLFDLKGATARLPAIVDNRPAPKVKRTATA